MRSLAEVTWEEDDKDGTPVKKKGKYWLLHFATKSDLVEVEGRRIIAVNYTVCICQDCETGQLREFMAPQLRILGDEIKK